MSRNDLEQPLSPSDAEATSSLQDERSVDERAVYDPSAPIEPAEASEAELNRAPEQIDGSAEDAGGSETAAEEEDSEAQSRADGNPASNYLDDDEEWLLASDQILHQSEDTVIAQQEDAVVSWDIQGLYDETGKVRGKRSLKNNPPMLVISDSTGENATFVLTKDLSGVLARHFDNTHRAYYGIRPKDELTFKEKLSDAKTGLRENMGKAIVVGGLLVALLLFGFIL